jgi:hypothetical protein
VADHWLLALLAALALAALAWTAPRAARRITAYHRQRHESYLRSESFSFEQLRRAARGGDAKSVYFALLEWLQRFAPAAPSHSARSLTAAAQDPVLSHEIGAIEHELFAPGRSAGGWSAHQLMRSLGTARRNLRPRAAHVTQSGLPQHLNPVGEDAASARRRRIPAR